MSAEPTLDHLLDIVKAVDDGIRNQTALQGLLQQALPKLAPTAAYARIYRVSGSTAEVYVATLQGDAQPLNQPTPFSQAVREGKPISNSDGTQWIAPLKPSGYAIGLLEIGFDTPPAKDTTADQLRLAAHILAPAVARSLAARNNESMITDNALNLVQAQYAATSAIYGSEDPAEILRAFNEFIRNTFTRSHLAIVDENDWAYVRIIAEQTERKAEKTDRLVALNTYPASESLSALEALSVPDVREDTFLTEEERNRLEANGTRALVLVPLVVSGRLMGLISFSHDEPARLSPARQRALRGLADQLAVVLQNRALLHEAQSATERLRQQVRFLEAVNQLAIAINNTTDEQTLLDLSSEIITKAIGIDHSGTAIFDTHEPYGTVVSEYPAQGAVGLRLSMHDSVYQYLSVDEPLVLNDLRSDANISETTRETLLGLGIRSVVILPLVERGKLIGSIGLDIYDEKRKFTPEMVETAQTMGAQVSLALQNIRLFKEAQAAAAQEQRINTIATRYQSVNSVDDLLRITLLELGETLGATRGAIRLHQTENGGTGHD